MKGRFSYIVNLVFPAFVFSAINGILTGAVVTVFKLLTKYSVGYSDICYDIIRKTPWLILAAILVLLVLSKIYVTVYKYHPNLQGGGIPTSVGILRGQLRFRWQYNLVGTFVLSLFSFFVGVPLGNEGPAVQMGTAIGRGATKLFANKHKAWARYSMTGGACAGFCSATGAGLSGIMFAIEEAHGRISPMIIIVAATSVMFSRVVTSILCPLLNVSPSLFPKTDMSELGIGEIWIALLVGVLLGLFAVVFLKYFKLVMNFFTKTLAKIPQTYRIFGVFVLTLIFGLICSDLISTGHHLTLKLFEEHLPILMLVGILLVRTTLTISANANGITGGLFLPLISLGAVVSALIFEAGSALWPDESYYKYIIALGIVACVSGMMKMPLTAILFGVEALGFENNILFAVVVSVSTYAVTEIFGVKSINDYVIERRLIKEREGKECKTVETEVTVSEKSFAVGKEIRDIFWPDGVFVLSIIRKQEQTQKTAELGNAFIHPGDILKIRYTTYNEEHTLKELDSIIK